MSIVIPIMFFAVALGLFVPHMTKGWWFLLAGWITLVLLYNYLKPTAVPISSGTGLYRNTHAITIRQA